MTVYGIDRSSSHISGMVLQIDIIKDVAARCAERLAEAGYGPVPTDAEATIYTYCNIRHRRVRPRPRKVHKAAYTVPDHLAAGEQQLLEKVAAGADLWPHQSRKIDRLAIEDGMLNDYGVQHFHLGTQPDKRYLHLIAGTKELLFALVKDDDFYAIGIFDHAWTRKEVMDIIDATWPSLTDAYTLKGGPGMKVLGLRHNYTDKEAKKLRAAGINVFQQRPDGRVQMGMGGGIASDLSSVAVRRETDRFIIHIEKVQKAVVERLEQEISANKLPVDATVRVVWDGEEIYAVTEPAVFRVNISGQLTVPSL